MDSRRVLTDLARQIYADLRFITGLNPVNIVDDDTTLAFNHLLKEARMAFPGHPLLEGLRDMQPRNIKYKDAAVVAGQLAGFLQLMTARDQRIASMMMEGEPVATGSAPGGGSMSSARVPKMGTATAPQGDDDELYGPVNPDLRRNADGTIKFSLD
jgi:hypothetical protein